ncbi:MAG: class I SAM-dependent methyltransferase [Chloroflexota bacterium]
MFIKSAAFYDAIYSFKDYKAEAEIVRRYAEQYKRAPGTALLDAACGTGHHLEYLAEHYQVEGFDLDAGLLEVARGRCPAVPFYQADMTNFDLGKQYDVLTCLFSAIGYIKTVERLNQTLQCFARHLRSGGVVLVEPWIYPEQFNAGHLGGIYVDQPALKIARINTSSVTDAEVAVATLHFHYLVGTPSGVEHFSEDHELGLFTDAHYRAAFVGAGLEIYFEAEGLDGRGFYIGVKP